MAEMMFNSREEYTKQISILLNKADLFELDKFLRVLVKHFYPKLYI